MSELTNTHNNTVRRSYIELLSTVQETYAEYLSLPYSQAQGTLSRKKTPSLPVMSGLLNYKLDRIFSRWQQQTFVLTNKSLKCYERLTFSHHNPSLLWKVHQSVQEFSLIM